MSAHTHTPSPDAAELESMRAVRAAQSLPTADEVIAIFGPTGVGKTEVAIAVADLLRRRGEQPVAISADALQVYRGLETLTGAATPAERMRLEHRLLGFVGLDSEFSVGEYMPLAHGEIDAALASGRRPIVVGGTGLYLRAALTELSLAPPPPPELRARLEQELAKRGTEALHARLAALAPRRAEQIEKGDRSRVVRALELQAHGIDATRAGESELWTAQTRRPTRLFGLVMDRDELYRRIDMRVEQIARAGAVDEVSAALAAGVSRTARKALGFDELQRGDIGAMKKRTRNYAKRQLTWMRKLAGVRLVDVTGRTAESVAQEVVAVVVRR